MPLPGPGMPFPDTFPGTQSAGVRLLGTTHNERMTMIDESDIPGEIIAVAKKLENYFDMRGIHTWELLGVCSRDHALRARPILHRRPVTLREALGDPMGTPVPGVGGWGNLPGEIRNDQAVNPAWVNATHEIMMAHATEFSGLANTPPAPPAETAAGDTALPGQGGGDAQRAIEELARSMLERLRSGQSPDAGMEAQATGSTNAP